jgi:hypothetical protein
MWRGSQYWLAGAAAAVGAYVLFSGHYVDLSVIDVGGDGDDDDGGAAADEAEVQRHFEEADDDDGGDEE